MKRAIAIAATTVGLTLSGVALADCNGAAVNNCGNTTDSHDVTATGGTGYGGAGYGGSSNVGNGFGNFSPSASARSDVDIRNTLGQQQGQGQLQGQKQGQGQVQGNVGLGSGNKTDITIEASPIPDTYKIRNTPGVALGGLYPSTNCGHVAQAGGSGPGFSVAVGLSFQAVECDKREAVRVAPTEADKVYVWCKLEAAQGAPSCASQQKAAAEPVKAAEASEPARPTKRVASAQEQAPRAWYQANPAIIGR